MHVNVRGNTRLLRVLAAFTLMEVVVSIAIVATIFSGVLMAYIQSARRAEWSGRSLAAQAMAIQTIEQIRSAVWDQQASSGTLGIRDEATNLVLVNKAVVGGVTTGYSWTNLDLPSSGTNIVNATNFVRIQNLSSFWPSFPNVAVRFIRVDTVWPCSWNGTNKLFTNTVCTYSSPDD